MAIVNAIVGAGINGCDRIIISKTTLNNNSIRYDIEFDFIPTSFNVYSWYDEFHDEFARLIDLFSSVGSKIIQEDNSWILVGPKIRSLSPDNELYIKQWDSDPFLITYEEQPVFRCDKTPLQVFIDELGFYPGEVN